MARRTIGQEGFSFVDGGNKSSLDDLPKLADWRAVDDLMAPISVAAKGELGAEPIAVSTTRVSPSALTENPTITTVVID